MAQELEQSGVSGAPRATICIRHQDGRERTITEKTRERVAEVVGRGLWQAEAAQAVGCPSPEQFEKLRRAFAARR